MTDIAELAADDTLYWRLHTNPTAPCFCVAHAYSGPWSATWADDGLRFACACGGTDILDVIDCRACGGHGIGRYGDDCAACEGLGSVNSQCRHCDGTGWVEAGEGYSCCHDIEDLAAYMREHAGTINDDEPVVAFTGRACGIGADGEPLVVPDGQRVHWTTWGEMTSALASTLEPS